MTSQYKTYPKYKDSGTKWIGEIPEGWEVHKLKRFSRIETGNTPSKEDERYYEDGNFPWIRPDELKEFQPILDSNIKLNKDGKKLARKIPKNSVLVCCIGSLGKIGIAGKELATNQQINSIILNEERCKFQFAKYIIFNSKREMERIGNANVVSIVNKSQQREIFYCLPSFPQQTTIANFLDSKNAKIDALIEKDKKLIELLKEKRTALINHAVTKGLDPNAKMKDSGIKWIREIPEGWDIVRLKNKTLIKYGSSLSELERNEGNINVFGSNGKIGKHNKSITKGKTIIIGRKGSHGKLNLSENSCFPIDTTYFIDNTCTKYDLKYLFYLITQLKLDETSRDSAVPGLSREVAYNKIIPYIPKQEQRAIAEYLDKHTAKIDKTIQKIQKKIELLGEYKKSLIHHTVTGKIDVRGSGI